MTAIAALFTGSAQAVPDEGAGYAATPTAAALKGDRELVFTPQAMPDTIVSRIENGLDARGNGLSAVRPDDRAAIRGPGAFPTASVSSVSSDDGWGGREIGFGIGGVVVGFLLGAAGYLAYSRRRSDVALP